MDDNASHQPQRQRHFTASGYVAHEGRVLLHWHRKVQALLPPGGHIEPNEDPVETVLREIKEETGLVVEILSTGLPLDVEYPTQVPPPETIMVEDIQDPEAGPHQHIDLIYFCRLVGPAEDLKDGWYWVSEEALISREAVLQRDGSTVQPPEDVRRLALEALRKAGNVG